ncbi:MAG: hypothetical protein KJ941_01170 [Bacteroidetes bacterium]|nr:hypothetical protein [Bacteroidota bacterium]
MKLHNLIVLALGLILITSCDKIKKDKIDHSLTYYSVDHQSKDATVLNENTAEMDAIWVTFYNKEKKEKEYTSYALATKKDGVVSKELGSCTIDWKNGITFVPDNGATYQGTWLKEKEKFTLTFGDEERTEDVTFVYKETKECSKK